MILETKTTFKNGIEDGLWEFFNRDGSLNKTDTWENNTLSGYAIQYNVDGTIIREGIFKDDEFLYAEIREKTDIDKFIKF